MTLPPSDTPRKFEYLLNAMEHASLFTNPAEYGYADKRLAVLEHVAALERELQSLRAGVVEGKRLRELQTGINHERKPHCIGCWHIKMDTESVNANVIAVCNECGERRDITCVLEFNIETLNRWSAIYALKQPLPEAGGKG